MSILDLLQYIVNEPAPRLTPPGRFPREAELFVDDCLRKDPGLRKNPKELLVSRHFMVMACRGARLMRSALAIRLDQMQQGDAR